MTGSRGAVGKRSRRGIAIGRTCIGESGRKIVVSVFGGSPFSTSDLSLRRRQRCRSRCSCVTSPLPTFPVFESKEASKISEEVKTATETWRGKDAHGRMAKGACWTWPKSQPAHQSLVWSSVCAGSIPARTLGVEKV